MRIIAVTILMTSVIALFTACSPSEHEVGDETRVIYWFTIDSLRADLIGLEYNGRLVMPALSEFVSKSAYFENAYSQSSYTKISVASMFTGTWPSRLGVKLSSHRVFPSGVIHGYGLDFGFSTLAEHLLARGYDTFTHQFNAQSRKGDGLLQGFQHQDNELNRPLIAKKLARGKRVFVYEHILGVHAPYQPSDAARESLGIAKASEVDPEFNSWFWKPLNPAMARELYEYYLAEANDTDRIFSEFVTFLKENDSWNDAMVIVTADHGEEFLEHGTTQHSSQLYEEVIRVPLFVKFPDEHRLSEFHGQRFPHRVRLVDLFPTIVELSGGEGPPSLDGVSLSPILQGDEPNLSGRPVIAYLSNRKPLGNKQYFFDVESIISGRYKAIKGYRVDDSQLPSEFPHARGDEVVELYDLEDDPFEKRNINSQNPDISDSLWNTYDNLFVTPHDPDRRPDSAKMGSVPSPGIEERVKTEKQLKALGYIE